MFAGFDSLITDIAASRNGEAAVTFMDEHTSKFPHIAANQRPLGISLRTAAESARDIYAQAGNRVYDIARETVTKLGSDGKGESKADSGTAAAISLELLGVIPIIGDVSNGLRGIKRTLSDPESISPQETIRLQVDSETLAMIDKGHQRLKGGYDFVKNMEKHGKKLTTAIGGDSAEAIVDSMSKALDEIESSVKEREDDVIEVLKRNQDEAA